MIPAFLNHYVPYQVKITKNRQTTSTNHQSLSSLLRMHPTVPALTTHHFSPSQITPQHPTFGFTLANRIIPSPNFFQHLKRDVARRRGVTFK